VGAGACPPGFAGRHDPHILVGQPRAQRQRDYLAAGAKGRGEDLSSSGTSLPSSRTCRIVTENFTVTVAPGTQGE
jgi:hypothetical protein